MIPLPSREEMEMMLRDNKFVGEAREACADYMRVSRNGDVTFLTEKEYQELWQQNQ